MDDPRTDAELLQATADEPEAFAVFYRRHVGIVIALAVRRLHDGELAADVTSEVFAAALEGSERFDPERGSARGWLLGILANQVGSALRRGAAESRARRRLGMEPIALDAGQRTEIEALRDHDHDHDHQAIVRELLDELPEPDRALLLGRVVEGRRYAQLSREFGLAEPALRKRVSRGLALLRTRLETREAAP